MAVEFSAPEGETVADMAVREGQAHRYWRERAKEVEEEYVLLREAVGRALGPFIHDDDVAEVAILCDAIEAAGVLLRPHYNCLKCAHLGVSQKNGFYCPECENEWTLPEVSHG